MKCPIFYVPKYLGRGGVRPEWDNVSYSIFFKASLIQFLAHRAPTGPMMMPLKTFSVNVISKKNWANIGLKFDPWDQFQNFNQLGNLAES